MKKWRIFAIATTALWTLIIVVLNPNIWKVMGRLNETKVLTYFAGMLLGILVVGVAGGTILFFIWQAIEKVLQKRIKK